MLRDLHALDESPWGDWYGHPLNPRDLARLLRPFGVAATKVKLGDLSVRGYRYADFDDAWARYLPATPAPNPGESP